MGGDGVRSTHKLLLERSIRQQFDIARTHIFRPAKTQQKRAALHEGRTKWCLGVNHQGRPERVRRVSTILVSHRGGR